MQLEVVQTSIIDLNTEVIVNPANPQLLRGGGLSGIIHSAAGDELFEWLKAYKLIQNKPALNNGEAIVSPSFKLKCKHIIHAVGPMWRGGHHSEQEVLRSTYITCIELAEWYKLKSIAFPNISTGIYGFPKKLAAPIIVDTLKSYPYSSIKNIVLACHDEENYSLYSELLTK